MVSLLRGLSCSGADAFRSANGDSGCNTCSQWYTREHNVYLDLHGGAPSAPHGCELQIQTSCTPELSSMDCVHLDLLLEDARAVLPRDAEDEGRQREFGRYCDGHHAPFL